MLRFILHGYPYDCCALFIEVFHQQILANLSLERDTRLFVISIRFSTLRHVFVKH